jgi:hypothetical protein
MVPPYGDDITERIPVPLSNPAGATSYALTGVAYDMAIAGLPFFVNASDDNPYRRVTAQYRKQQIDQTREAGEQTLTGWWLRSQSSFHQGQGINFFEPIQEESLRFQYTESKGCDIWTRGQVTLLNSVSPEHVTTGTLTTNNRPQQIARSIQWQELTHTGSTTYNTYDGILLWDEYDVDKVYPTITASINNKALTTNVATLTTTTAHRLAPGMEIEVTGVDTTFNGTYTITTVPTATTFTYAKVATNVTSTPVSPVGSVESSITHFIDYNSGSDYKVYGICDDGVYAYWVTNVLNAGTPRLRIYKKLLSDDSSVSPTLMISENGITVTSAVLEYTKERIVAAINNKVYEIATNATSLPTAVYTHPDNDVVFTGITSSGAAIYVSSFSGIQSTIAKFTLSTTGTMPTLTSAITAAELPVGEIVYDIYYYLGYLAIGTSKGIRIAVVSDDGSINYGPLITNTTHPCYDFAARDSYLWCATSVDNNPGVIRINLGTRLGTDLNFAYCNDLYAPTVTGFDTTTCAFMGDTNQLAFVTANNGTTNGAIYVENMSEKISEGYLQTGFIRYNTLELKVFKLLQARIDTTNGGLGIDTVTYNNQEYRIGTFNQESGVPEVTVSYPTGAQEYLGFKFTLTRSTTNTALGPVFNGYNLKALPAVPRQRLIQYPLFCYDHESDKFGVEEGYEGSAYERMSALEQVENVGDTVRVQDFRTGESYLGLIEELDFINKTPSGPRFSGYGGTLVVTIRSIS